MKTTWKEQKRDFWVYIIVTDEYKYKRVLV